MSSGKPSLFRDILISIQFSQLRLVHRHGQRPAHIQVVKRRASRVEDEIIQRKPGRNDQLFIELPAGSVTRL
jgi:hypothetical protein